MQEQGFPGFEATTWYGLVGPGKLPPPIADKVNRDVNTVLAQPDVQEKLDTYGAEDGGGSREKFRQFIAHRDGQVGQGRQGRQGEGRQLKGYSPEPFFPPLPPTGLAAAMSLPHFIHESLDDILCEWERECGTAPRGAAEPAVRRVHFGKVLQAVADEMKRIKAAADPAAAIASPAAFERRPNGDAPAAPHSHASQLVDDYALLRASVVRLWRKKHPSPSADDLDDLVHFNQAMDRSLAELAATFSPSESQPQSLFLGVLNHELRTSVASILMSAQVLTHRSTPGTPEAKAAQRILRSCEQLRQSLDALSDFTKVRLGDHLEIDRVPDDMACSAGRRSTRSHASTPSGECASPPTAT